MSGYIGAPTRRLEDRILIRGQGQFIADLTLPGLLEAVLVRSPEAHGTLRSVRAQEARKLNGVRGVFTAPDLPESARTLSRPFYRLEEEFVKRHEVFLQHTGEPVLAMDIVRRVGEPIALVVADNRYVAEDAREKVEVDIEVLRPVVHPERALEADSPQVDPNVQGNLHARFHVTVGRPEPELDSAPRSIFRRFRIGRSAGSPIENRGVAASCEGDRLTVWSTTQVPHVLRSYLSELLSLDEVRIRVVAPDMGGSFGGGVYPEEILVPWSAMRLGRPVRWLEDRGEELTNSRHSRDQIVDTQLAYDNDGHLRALNVKVLQDCGASNPFGITLPYNLVSHIRGQYKIDHFEATGLCALTNKTRNTPVRGAGRPEAVFVMERLIELVARELALDPAEVRRRNLILPGLMPHDMEMLYRDGNELIYDSGDFPAQLEAALKEADYPGLRGKQEDARREGRRLGIGIAGHVEGTGYGPHETAEVVVDLAGEVSVRSGSQSHGQSHATTLAQVCAEALGVEPAQIQVRSGDTALVDRGGGTFGSRSAVTAGSAVHLAATEVRNRLLEAAADLLEAAVEDLVLEGGRVHPRGVPSAAIPFESLVAAASTNPGEGQDPAIRSVKTYVPPSVTFASGTQVALVEVDEHTGAVTVKDVWLVEDCGTILNPMVVDGQQHGGIAHGLGNALLEEVSYSEDGQPLSTTFMDYLLPTASDMPRIHVTHRPHPTPLNPLGVKGTGEGATSSTPAAIANAIADALSDLAIDMTEIPITQPRLLELIQSASAASPLASKESSL